MRKLMVFTLLIISIKPFSQITNDELHKKIEEEISREAMPAYVKAFATIYNLREEVKLAKKNIITKQSVIAHFNEILGNTMGELKSFNAVDKRLQTAGDTYIKIMFLKEEAAIAKRKGDAEKVKIAALTQGISIVSFQFDETKIREYAKSQYPSDISMQNYIYKEQMSACNYMSTVIDMELKRSSVDKYPTDFTMQKYTYDEQVSAKRYMKNVDDLEIKEIALRKYSFDYSMQKYTYDQQMGAKEYMSKVNNMPAKIKAQIEYPNDYSMQEYIYQKLVFNATTNP